MTGSPTTGGDPLAALVRRRGVRWRTFAVPHARVMFVQVNKNACTSLKWMMAGIAGEDLDGFAPSLAASTSEQDDIHDRTQWKHSPWLDQMDPALRAQIHPDNGWFIFAVVRDPRARLFSAWESKLLLDNPGYTSSRAQPWYPRHPLSAESVVEDFAKFVDLFEREPDHRLRGDGHFRDQVEMLHQDLVTYTKIYDIRELGRLQADLRKHLDQVGWVGELYLPRLNDTPLRPNAQVFANGIRERVEKIYAADFERFGDRWDFSAIEAVPKWTDEELHEAEWRAVFGRRIGYLRSQALRFREDASTQRKRADAEKARADQLQRQLNRRQPQSLLPAQLRAQLKRVGTRARQQLRGQ